MERHLTSDRDARGYRVRTSRLFIRRTARKGKDQQGPRRWEGTITCCYGAPVWFLDQRGLSSLPRGMWRANPTTTTVQAGRYHGDIRREVFTPEKVYSGVVSARTTATSLRVRVDVIPQLQQQQLQHIEGGTHGSICLDHRNLSEL